MLACSENQLVEIKYEESLYKDFQAVYDRLLYREYPGSWCILPLIENTDIFIFLILKRINNKDARIAYENIAAHISNMLRGSRLLNEIRKTYSELQSTQHELKRELEVARILQKSLLPNELLQKDFKMAARSPVEIIDCIIADLSGFVCDDDVTIFAVKRV